MPEGKVVKSVFDMLCNLNKQGFQTWTTRVCELARLYDIDINKIADLTLIRWCPQIYMDRQPGLVGPEPWFLPDASIGLRVLSLPASVCLSVCLSVCPSVRQSRACPRDNS